MFAASVWPYTPTMPHMLFCPVESGAFYHRSDGGAKRRSDGGEGKAGAKNRESGKKNGWRAKWAAGLRRAPLRRFETRLGAPSMLPSAVLPLVRLAAFQSVV